MAIDKKDLSKIIKIINSKNEKKNQPSAPTRRVDPKEKNAEYKAAAVLNALSPTLNAALERKDPTGYRNLNTAIQSFTSNRIAELDKNFKSGIINAKEYKKQFQDIQQNRNDFIANYDYNNYLNPQEVRNALGKNYDDFVSAYRIAFSSGSERGLSHGIVGQKETPSNLSEVKYGKLFMTNPRVSGFENPDYSVFYMYDPSTGSISIDKDRSKNIDFNTGEPLISKTKEQVKFVK